MIASGRWTGEEAYRKINKSPVQLVEGTDFIKLPREEALNRKVQRQRVHIPTFGPVPLVESTPTPTQSTEPTLNTPTRVQLTGPATETPPSTPILLSSPLSTPIGRILQREVEMEFASLFYRTSITRVGNDSTRERGN